MHRRAGNDVLGDEETGAPCKSPEVHGGTSRRTLLRQLTNEQLVAAMRADDGAAWAEFEQRFRPLLHGYARRTGIPTAEWSVCVDDVLEDEMLRLTGAGVATPQHLEAYLVRAVRHKHMRLIRSAKRRERRYDLAIDGEGEPVVRSLTSAAALRESEGPIYESGREEDATSRLAALLCAELTPEEELLLSWVAEQVPRRQIAAWTGVGYEAACKRIQRLTLRLRQGARER